MTPTALRKLNWWLATFWLANYPPVIALYLLLSSEQFQTFCLLYLALVSIWANVAGHLGATGAARTEVAQEGAADDVVDAMVLGTTVEASTHPPTTKYSTPKDSQ